MYHESDPQLTWSQQPALKHRHANTAKALLLGTMAAKVVMPNAIVTAFNMSAPALMAINRIALAVVHMSTVQCCWHCTAPERWHQL